MARLENVMSWSVSRERLFRQCERAYYYQYYGAWGGWERDATPECRQLYVLKNMTNLPMWVGSIVHETIAEALNRFAAAGNRITTGELQARARHKLRAGWVEATNEEWRQRPKKTNLQELYYGNGKTLPKEQTEAAKAKTYAALEAFADSGILKELLAVSYMDWKPVDKLDSFSLDGLKVWCAVDFAHTKPDGHLRIVDWKTGSEQRDSLRVQLACYAVYAAEKWHMPWDRVELQGVFLSDGARVSTYAVTPESIFEARDHILTSAADMRKRLVDVERNAAREDDFPCCENASVCGRCNFREACPCGMAG